MCAAHPLSEKNHAGPPSRRRRLLAAAPQRPVFVQSAETCSHNYWRTRCQCWRCGRPRRRRCPSATSLGLRADVCTGSAESTPVIREEDPACPAGAHARQQPHRDVQRRLVRVFREHDVPVAPRRVRDRRHQLWMHLRAGSLQFGHQRGLPRLLHFRWDFPTELLPS